MAKFIIEVVKSTNTGPHRGNLFVLCNGVTLRQSNGKWEMTLVESQKVEPNSDLYIVGNMTSIINPRIWNMVVVDSTSGQDYGRKLRSDWRPERAK